MLGPIWTNTVFPGLRHASYFRTRRKKKLNRDQVRFGNTGYLSRNSWAQMCQVLPIEMQPVGILAGTCMVWKINVQKEVDPHKGPPYRGTVVSPKLFVKGTNCPGAHKATWKCLGPFGFGFCNYKIFIWSKVTSSPPLVQVLLWHVKLKFWFVCIFCLNSTLSSKSPFVCFLSGSVVHFIFI